MKAAFLIDGFNVYNSIRQLQKDGHGNFRWFDIRRYCHSLLSSLSDGKTRVDIHSAHFFTASPTHFLHSNRKRLNKHSLYCQVLRDSLVTVHLGAFMQTGEYCQDCHSEASTFKEKKTDVSIAINAIKLGNNPDVDIVVIISGDTDQIPTIDYFKEAYPSKRIVIVFPYDRSAFEISQTGVQTIQMKVESYSKFQFPDPYVATNGNCTKKPIDW